jgi:hypothetical protein
VRLGGGALGGRLGDGRARGRRGAEQVDLRARAVSSASASTPPPWRFGALASSALQRSRRAAAAVSAASAVAAPPDASRHAPVLELFTKLAALMAAVEGAPDAERRTV